MVKSESLRHDTYYSYTALPAWLYDLHVPGSKTLIYIRALHRLAQDSWVDEYSDVRTEVPETG